MSHLSITDIVDPRGRADRKGLAIVAAILLAVQLVVFWQIQQGALNPGGPAAWTLNTILLWVGVAAVSKRLHDTGRSAAWILWALLATFVWSFIVSFAVILLNADAAAAADNPYFILAFIISFAPLFIAALWLHAAKSDPGENEFGPETDASGFSRPDAASHAGTAA